MLNHVPLRVKAELDDLPLAPKRKDPAQPTVHLVCRDKEVMLHLAEILDMENQTLIYEQSFNITGGEEAAAAFYKAVKDAQATIPGMRDVYKRQVLNCDAHSFSPLPVMSQRKNGAPMKAVSMPMGMPEVVTFLETLSTMSRKVPPPSMEQGMSQR